MPLGETVPDVETKVLESAKAMSLRLKRWSLSMSVCDEERGGREGVCTVVYALDCTSERTSD